MVLFCIERSIGRVKNIRNVESDVLYIVFGQVPNGLGTVSGIIQLVLYAVYYKSTDWSDPKKQNQGQGQGQGQAQAQVELQQA